MTPTREQLIEQAIQGHAGTRMAMQWLFDQAHAAGRAQGLREAREVCEKEAENFGGVAAGPFATDFGKHTHNAMAAGAKNCAAAIQQLEGRPR